MSTPAKTLETRTTEVLGLISTAQRNGMASSDAIAVGIKPSLLRIVELEAENTRLRHHGRDAATEAVEFLRSQEWSNNGGCPLCLRRESEGHANGCSLEAGIVSAQTLARTAT